MSRRTKAKRRAAFRREHLWLAELARLDQWRRAFDADLAAGLPVWKDTTMVRVRSPLLATAPHPYSPWHTGGSPPFRCEACGREGEDALHGRGGDGG